RPIWQAERAFRSQPFERPVEMWVTRRQVRSPGGRRNPRLGNGQDSVNHTGLLEYEGGRGGKKGGRRSVGVRATCIALGVLGLVCAGASCASAQTAAQTGSGDYPVANDVRVGGDARQTRFVIDLSRKVEIHAFTLPDPYRVVIDLPQ